MKKYKLTNETKTVFGIKFYRIKALKSFGLINKNDLGGWITKEDNLSQDGNAWVYGDARVYGNARVYGSKWESSPIQIQGTQHFINECKKGFIKIGCYELKISEWVKQYKEIGENNGYSDKQIQEYGLYIELIKNLKKLK